MSRACLWTLLTASVLPAAAIAQESPYNDALGHALHGYYAGRLLEAQGELGQLIQITPADPRPYYFRGLCAWQMGRAAEAQRDFARGAELEQADPQHWSDVSASLARVQGSARRMLEGYRAPVRLALGRQRDAQRLAQYGIGPSRPAIEQVAANPARVAMQPPVESQPAADALPMPAATPAAVAEEKPGEDPFAAPVAGAKPAAPAEDPFAAPAATPMPPAAADTSTTADNAAPAASAAKPADAPMPPAASADVAANAPPAAAPPVATPAASSAPPAAADASTPEGTVAAAIAAIDQPQNLWPLLPAQYQTDIQGLVNQFGGKMDAELWDRTFGVLKKLVKLGKEKRELILKQPLLAAVPGGTQELTQNWDRGMELLDTLFASEISTVAGLKTFDPAAFLAGTGGRIAKLVADMPPPAAGTPGGPSLAQLKAAKITPVKTEGDTATVSVAVEGKPPIELELKRTDGKWLPAQMIDGWSTKVAAAKASLDQLNIAAQKPQGMMMLQMADGVLDQLLAAKDEAAFNAALAPILGLLGQFGGKLPMGGAPGGMPPGMPLPGGTSLPGGPPTGPPGAPTMGPPGAPPTTPAP